MSAADAGATNAIRPTVPIKNFFITYPLAAPNDRASRGSSVAHAFQFHHSVWMICCWGPVSRLQQANFVSGKNGNHVALLHVFVPPTFLFFEAHCCCGSIDVSIFGKKRTLLPL